LQQQRPAQSFLAFDFARPSLLVKAFWIALLDGGDWGIDIYFDKRKAILIVKGAGNGTIGLVWRDKRRQADRRCIRKQLRHLRDCKWPCCK